MRIVSLKFAGILFSTIVLLSTLNMSCSSGKKALEHGDYYEASLKAINRLRTKPNSKNASQTLKQSYPYAVDYFEKKVYAVRELNDPLKYSNMVTHYEKLNHLASEIERCPAARKVIPSTKTYYAELKQARTDGAAERYRLGKLELERNTRSNAKKAYYHFIAADKMIRNYKNINELIIESKYLATLKVLLEQIPVSGSNNEISSTFFYNQIIETLRKNSATEFVRFITTVEMDMENIEPDQLLQMHFQEFVIGQLYEKETIREVSKDSVVVGAVTLDDGTTLDAYNTVKAKVNVLQRQLLSKGLLDILIVNAYNGQTISQKKFSGQFVWVSEWATYTGDKRALSEQDVKLTKMVGENPPPMQQLFIEFTKPIYNQTLPYLKTFYLNY